MPIPSSVQRLLEDNQYAYDIAEIDDGASIEAHACVVKSLLLQDTNGKVQLLIPAHRVVDLDAINQEMGRCFEGVHTTQVFALIEPMELAQVPALPMWQDIPLLIDGSLQNYAQLYLESGEKNNIVKVDQAVFSTIIAKGKLSDFTKALPSLESDPSKDEALISESVERFTELRIKKRLEDTLEMPPMPETGQKIIHLRSQPDCDISELADIVELDPSLAAQVVSWAASPYYSAPGKIRSVQDAVVRVLGFDMVMNLALGLALGRSFDSKSMTKQQLQEYWQGAVYTAATVESLITGIAREHRPSFGLSYLSGLLSNFGQLVMAEVFPPHYQSVQRAVNANHHLPPAHLEQNIIGITSNQMAAWLLENWEMPHEVIVAVRQQHNPNYSGEHSTYAKIVYLAQTMLGNHGIGKPLGGPLPDHLFKSLHLDRKDAYTAVESVLEGSEELMSMADMLRV